MCLRGRFIPNSKKTLKKAVADLQGRRNGDDLLDGATESLDVVVPVEHLPDVEVLHRIVLKVSLSINQPLNVGSMLSSQAIMRRKTSDVKMF